MTNVERTGIYLVVDFEWSQTFEPKYGELARALHKSGQNKSWIREVLAASGGIGSGQSSM